MGGENFFFFLPPFFAFEGTYLHFKASSVQGQKKKRKFKAVCVFVCAKINWYTSAAVVTRGIRGKVLEKAWFFDLRATFFCPLDFQTVVNSRYQKKARHRVDKDSDVPAGKFPGRQQRVPFKNRGRFKVFLLFKRLHKGRAEAVQKQGQKTLKQMKVGRF